MARAGFTKRERRAIVIATIAFLIISAGTHFMLGGLIERYLPRAAAIAAEPSPNTVIIETPTPTPSPTPKPPTLTPQPRHAVATHNPFAVHTPRITVTTAPGAGSPSPQRSAGPETPMPASSPASVQPTPAQSPQTVPSATPITANAMQDARFRNRIVPSYTQVCTDENASGETVIYVTIGPDGSLVEAHVGQTSGYRCLDEAALEAAKESTYFPPEVDGRPTTQTYRIIYDFALES